jgi:DNA-binding NarL/FixJ family response regulator
LVEEPPVKRLRVLVADDHQAMLESLVHLLAGHFDVVAAVRDGGAVVTEAVRLNPDVLVLDVAMPVMSGIAAAGRLQAAGSTAKIVFVTMYQDREFVQESSTLGAVGFVVKSRLMSDLLPAIQDVLSGRSFVSPTVPR